MSGVELIVGAVLGGIPVVLEAYDRYQALSRAFQTFKHAPKELAKLNTRVRTQKILFRIHVVKILVAITRDPERCEGLLLGEGEDWSSLELNDECRKQADILRDSFLVWESHLDHIKDSLTRILSVLEGFKDKKLFTKLNLSLKKGAVKDEIQELREFTGDFCALTGQILNDLGKLKSTSAFSSTTAVSRTKDEHRSRLESYRRVQRASEGLYDALASRWLCDGHQQHWASLALNSDNLEALPEEKAIKFKISITSLDAFDGSLCLNLEYVDRRWPGLAIQRKHSPATSSLAWSDMMDTLHKHSDPMVIDAGVKVTQNLPKRPREQTSTCEGEQKKLKAVRFLEPSNQTISTRKPEVKRESVRVTAGETTIANLDKVKNYCQHFFQERPSAYVQTCIGYFNYRGLCRFYSADWQMCMHHVSLADVISWIADDRTSRSLPKATMVHFASSLACAVLQYHSTPWLPENWESSHVKFCDASSNLVSSIDFRQASLFFKAVLASPVGAASKPTSGGREVVGSEDRVAMQLPRKDNSMPSPNNTLPRNEMLFRLGIVLLELGYSRIWSRLREMIIWKLPATRQTDYHAAVALTRISKLRHRMGPQYPVLVRKCLGCDFGLGEDDMKNEDLQGAFLVEVVNVLHEMENGLRNLRID